MDFKQVKFEEVSNDVWDSWVRLIHESTYLHSSMFLGFLHRLLPADHRHTFACLSREDSPIALCPFGICPIRVGEKEFIEASWNGASLGAPAILAPTPNLRRKIRAAVLQQYAAFAQEFGIQRILMRTHPLSIHVQGGGYPRGQFEMLAEGFECFPQNTIVIDLMNEEDRLELELSRDRRSRIRHSIKKGLVVRPVQSPGDETRRLFRAYQQAHFNSAGRLTRPQESFDWMMRLLEENRATLFVEFADGIAVSFLYCGEFGRMAFSWSQVNVEDYEKAYAPRHNLEWQAILHYKKRGFKFYELGTRWYGPQPFFIPSEKELSIAEFKERYGGVLMGDLTFEKILDKELSEYLHSLRFQKFRELV